MKWGSILLLHNSTLLLSMLLSSLVCFVPTRIAVSSYNTLVVLSASNRDVRAKDPSRVFGLHHQCRE